MIFDERDYAQLFQLFSRDYAGHRPEVQEVPNGDGKIDAQKRYLHVALKYDPPEWALHLLARAHFEACRMAEALNVPSEFYPRVADGTLRVLDYPPGAGSEWHTDFDLFTVNLWRDVATGVVIKNEAGHCSRMPLDMHMGEIGELIGLGTATEHCVTALDRAQHSIVYFSMPDHAAVLRDGVTVREWLKERYARSRVTK